MKTILIVEDEKILSELYRDKISKEGFRVVTAETVKQALHLAEKEKPNLIILDILLPQENGIDFLKKVKYTPQVSSIPVVVFSNFDDPQTRKQALDLGARDYLIKSNFDPKETLARIKKYI